MAKLKRLLVNAAFEIAQRQRGCSRNGGHVIPQGHRCLVIKENMAKRNYCLECADAILQKAQADLRALAGELQGSHRSGQELSGTAGPIPTESHG